MLGNAYSRPIDAGKTPLRPILTFQPWDMISEYRAYKPALYGTVMYLLVWPCLRPPIVTGRPLYFAPVVSIFLLHSFVFFSSPNLSGGSLHVYHTSTHDVALVRNSTGLPVEMWKGKIWTVIIWTVITNPITLTLTLIRF